MSSLRRDCWNAALVSPHVLSLLTELLEGVAGLTRYRDEDLPGVSLWTRDGDEDRPGVPVWTRVRLGDGERRLQTSFKTCFKIMTVGSYPISTPYPFPLHLPLVLKGEGVEMGLGLGLGNGGL